ncbi:hypothetical protein VTI74DRAFT_6083 [Chaetomium olivicolor]
MKAQANQKKRIPATATRCEVILELECCRSAERLGLGKLRPESRRLCHVRDGKYLPKSPDGADFGFGGGVLAKKVEPLGSSRDAIETARMKSGKISWAIWWTSLEFEEIPLNPEFASVPSAATSGFSLVPHVAQCHVLRLPREFSYALVNDVEDKKVAWEIQYLSAADITTDFWMSLQTAIKPPATHIQVDPVFGNELSGVLHLVGPGGENQAKLEVCRVFRYLDRRRDANVHHDAAGDAWAAYGGAALALKVEYDLLNPVWRRDAARYEWPRVGELASGAKKQTAE